MSGLTVGSLFSGIGGFELGFERAGMKVLWQAESNKQARQILRRHWPNTHCYEDVKDVRDARPVDVICGGFPCQDYSVAGERGGLAGDRGALWWEMHRIIAEQRPTWVVGENVPGMLSSRGGRDFLEIVRSLVQLGYGVTWATLDSQYFRVAQRRRRLFIIGHSGGIARPEILAIGQGLRGHPAPSRKKGEKIAPTVTGGAPYNRTGNERVEVDALVLADDHGDGEVGDNFAPTLRARGYKCAPIAFCTAQMTSKFNGSNPKPGDPCHTLHQNEPPSVTNFLGSGPRRITPSECELLQGFPGQWTAKYYDGSPVSDTVRYKTLGNAVTVNVAEWIGQQIS